MSIDMEMLGSLMPAVKSVCWDNDMGKVPAGTAGNEIREVASSDARTCTVGPAEKGTSTTSRG